MKLLFGQPINQTTPWHLISSVSEDLMFRAAGELPESGAGSTGHLFQATEEEMKSRYWA